MKWLLLIPAVFIGGIVYLVWYSTTPAAKAVEAQRAAKIEDDKKPRKVSEADGCEVWAFAPTGRWLYFARCGAKTEVVNTWDVCRSVSQGKTQRTECTQHTAAVPQEPKAALEGSTP